MALRVHETGNPAGSRIGGRFQVVDVLGRGGMATVLRVTEIATQRPLALKRLTVPDGAPNRAALVGLFEREFFTLAQLSHPRVIEVYDYGVEDAVPYYTMEILDGGDLRERSPLPWQQACELLVGVCSSLALIHSRRLVHRDVSPANIRCTQAGGAKLIDFGAMAPFGRPESVVGTPAFVAPEVVHGEVVDGRTDLFSFGATLYFALTGQPPYPARSFSQLVALWAAPPPPPSSIVGEIPRALDSLVMSLLSLEPVMRPRSAFEVMQRLTAIAGLKGLEPIDVPHSYLSTPVLVGRDDAMSVLRAQLTEGLAGSPRCVLVGGASGVGRSRVLEAIAVEGKLLGASVVHARATSTRGVGLAVAQSIASQLLEALPQVALESARTSGTFSILFDETGEAPPRLRTLTDAGAQRAQLQTGVCDWILRISESHPVALAIDDAHAIDDASAAMIASLLSKARGQRLFVAASVETGLATNASPALDVLVDHSMRVELGPLTRAQTEELLGSLFGDAQHLGLVSERIHRASAGNPRACIELARHLVDRGVISYAGGGWALPVRLGDGDLPAAQDANRDRIAALPPLARWLAETQAIANDALGRGDYHALRPDAEPHRIDAAIGELLSRQVLVAAGDVYALPHRGWISALQSGIDGEERAARHRALAALYEERLPIVAAGHLLAGGLVERGLDRLAGIQKRATEPATIAAMVRIPSAERASTIERALDAATALGRPVREINDLRVWLLQLSVNADDSYYWRVAPAYLEQLKRDSGFSDWLSVQDASDPAQRLQRALGAAAKRHADTPEHERGFPPKEAIQRLVYYVVASIAVGSRTLNAELMDSLPPLLEPFAPLSPLADIIWHNSMALREANCRGQIERARARWIDVHEKLGRVSAAEVPYVARLRNAVLFGIGAQEVRMGLTSSVEWTERLAADPSQHVNALYLRKVMALHVGDASEAERYRKEAEVLALQTLDPQMFNATLPLELGAHALSGDLTGVQQLMARIRPLAQTSTGWRAYSELAEGYFQLLRADLEAARAAFERCIVLVAPDASGVSRIQTAWPVAVACLVETLVELGRHTEARDRADAALRTCATVGMDFLSHEVARALALAEAKLGAHDAAAARLEAVIEARKQLGVAGPGLGAVYEARARIAIWAGDEVALEKYAGLTAAEYRHGRGSTLGARWERLMAEARAASSRTPGAGGDVGAGAMRTGNRASASRRVGEALASATTAQERAERAVRLLCEDRGSRIGHLYLVGDEGLALAASHGQVEPPQGLIEYVLAYFGRSISEDAEATAALTGTQVASMLTGGDSFRDEEGTEYQG
ncbi:MAG: protein kinase domain-containing protein, partial [Polyangiaceae bacterium]